MHLQARAAGARIGEGKGRTMNPVIFAGPTLWKDPILQTEDLAWLPPAGQGDVYRIAQKRPSAIGLIDGRFETCPAVWHKEILWALTQGIPVYGAASMGALRAAELYPFGMIGVGAIYERYRSGEWEDDDEVAVVHSPVQLGYQPLTVAMADIRATLDSAAEAGIVSPRAAGLLTAFAKSLFFKDRTWAAVLAHPSIAKASRRVGRPLAEWLPENRVEQKRIDALAMVGIMREHSSVRKRRVRPAFDFQDTAHWRRLIEAAPAD